MMRLGRRATLLVALTLLTSATTASAGCSWVVWTKDDRHDWAPLGAEVVHEKCEYAAKMLTDERGKSDGGRKLGLQFTCLPDTLDPRGPKSK
jgi:hypothetical protein